MGFKHHPAGFIASRVGSLRWGLISMVVVHKLWVFLYIRCYVRGIDKII